MTEETRVKTYREPLAILPDAMGVGFTIAMSDGYKPPPIEVKGKVATLAVRGMLEHHANNHCDSYDSIKARMWEACSTQAEVVLLSVDSPGGLVSGAFDCSDELRAIADAGGKRLVAYVDGTTCSAAYALACAASEIVVPPAGLVGSVGVFYPVVDESAAAERAGVSVRVYRSGAYKALGSIKGEPLCDLVDDEEQRKVDSQAAVLFGLVARARGMTPDVVAAMQGRVFVGAEAVAQGLADSVESEDQLVARLNGEAPAVSEAPKGQENTSMDLDEMKKALKALAEGDDQEQAKRAKAALAALDGENEKEHEEPDGDEAKAEGDGEPDGDEKETEEESKASKALALAESAMRAQIMSTRSDLTEAQRKTFAALPVDQLQKILEVTPRNPSPVEQSLAAANAKPTVSGKGARFGSEADALVAAALGESNAPVTQRIENVLTMRACTPEEARRHLAALSQE